jgi:hypothetical protein
VYAMACKYMNYDANDFSSVQGCIANYQKWDELVEEQICGGNQESFTVKLYVLLDAHLLAID